MINVNITFTRVDVNSQIAEVRSQIEKLVAFSDEHIGLHFGDAAAVLNTDNTKTDHTLQGYLNQLESLVGVRDCMLDALLRETDSLNKRMAGLTTRVQDFSLPVITQTSKKKSVNQ